MLDQGSCQLIPTVLFTGFALISGSAAAAPGDVQDPARSLHGDLDTSGPIRNVGLPSEPVPHGSHSVHVEFGGGTNGSRRTAGNCNGSMTQPFGDPTKAAAIYQAVIEDWSAFDIQVTDAEPATGTYTTVLTGDNGCCGALGVAPVICGDEDLNAVVHVCRDDLDVNTLAAAVSQEAAHTYGLMHVNDQEEIMNPYASGTRQSFKDACYSYNPGYCSEQRVHCSGQQNSYRELIDIFGDAAPDLAPPTVSITYPTDGETFDVGANFTITATAADDKQVTHVELFVDNANQGSRMSEPYEWGVSAIPEGTYAFHAIAHDFAGNSTQSDTVTVYVGTDGPPPDTGSSGGTEGETGTLDDGGSGLPPGLTDGLGESQDDGCGCRSSAPAAGWSLFALAMLGLRRRD